MHPPDCSTVKTRNGAAGTVDEVEAEADVVVVVVVESAGKSLAEAQPIASNPTTAPMTSVLIPIRR